MECPMFGFTTERRKMCETLALICGTNTMRKEECISPWYWLQVWSLGTHQIIPFQRIGLTSVWTSYWYCSSQRQVSTQVLFLVHLHTKKNCHFVQMVHNLWSSKFNWNMQINQQRNQIYCPFIYFCGLNNLFIFPLPIFSVTIVVRKSTKLQPETAAFWMGASEHVYCEVDISTSSPSLHIFFRSNRKCIKRKIYWKLRKSLAFKLHNMNMRRETTTTKLSKH